MPASLARSAARAAGRIRSAAVRGLAPLALALLLASAARAQELVGTLRLGPDGPPASGVILLALHDSEGTSVARTVTGANGNFLLRVPAGAVRLRALRVGFRPADLGRHAVAAGERLRLDLAITSPPVQLAAVTTRADLRCRRLGDAGAAVATLFDEARKALLASQLTPPDGRPAIRILLETRVDAPDGTPVSSPLREVRDGGTTRPFRSAPPGQLAAFGYTREEPDGTIYYAPDADVLLSDQFAAGHCLRLAAADRDRPERSGIAFEPVDRPRGRVGIEGTLWLDRATLALQEVEFRYVGLPAALQRAGLGGSIRFTQLPGGLWFEDAWEIRMPRTVIERVPRVGTTVEILRVAGIQRTGGRVLAIEAAGLPLYLAPDAEVLSAAAAEDALALRIGCVTPEGVVPDSSGAVYGAVREPGAVPSPGATVTAEWSEAFELVGGTFRWRRQTLTTTAASDGFYAVCGAPRERLVTMRGAQGARRTAPVGVRLDRDADRVRADLEFPPPR